MQFKTKLGCFPKELLADKTYRTKKIKKEEIIIHQKTSEYPSNTAEIIKYPRARNPAQSKA